LFKVLLREWWRVAVACNHDYNHKQLREVEGRLFGHAWLKEEGSDKTWAMQSQVRLRLEEWRNGNMHRWSDKDPKVLHKEVGEQGRNVGSQLYLGYGPLTYRRNVGTALKSAPAINANDAMSFKMVVPDQHQEVINQALDLIHWFGTVGGRSRNGWGSFLLEGINGYTPPAIDELLSGVALGRLYAFTRDFGQCFEKDWPHALGFDEQGPLLWKSKNSYDDWPSAMGELARVKIAFRTACSIERNQDKEQNGICNPCFDNRHLLAYPVTHHGVEGWVEKDNKGFLKRDKWGYLKQSERLANQLRFKVIKVSGNRFWGLAIHLPCGLPEVLKRKLGGNEVEYKRQLQIWKTVHNILNTEMQRIETTQGGLA
jgi:CRISPR-associated protein Cmr1